MHNLKKYFFHVLFLFTSIIFLIFPAGKCYSTGLSSPCGAMYLSNLKIGQTYSLKQYLGYGFRASYNGYAMVDLVIDASPAGYSDYAPIPDINWIKIDRNEFSLDPGETAETDILITIPNDEKLLGKKFGVYINPKTGTPRGAKGDIVFGAALLCRLGLEIAPKPPTLEEIRLIKKQQFGGAVSVLISPDRIFVNEVPAGKRIDLKKDYGEAVKIINSSDFKVAATVTSMDPKIHGLFPQTGYIFPEKTDWLKIGKPKLSVEMNSIKEVPLFIEIPKDKKGKKYFFLVVVDIKSKINQTQNFVKVYVETQSPETQNIPVSK